MEYVYAAQRLTLPIIQLTEAANRISLGELDVPINVSTKDEIGTLGEASTINPFLQNDSEADFRCKMLFDDFVHIAPDTYQPQPGIAAEWMTASWPRTVNATVGVRGRSGGGP